MSSWAHVSQFDIGLAGSPPAFVLMPEYHNAGSAKLVFIVVWNPFTLGIIYQVVPPHLLNPLLLVDRFWKTETSHHQELREFPFSNFNRNIKPALINNYLLLILKQGYDEAMKVSRNQHVYSVRIHPLVSTKVTQTSISQIQLMRSKLWLKKSCALLSSRHGNLSKMHTSYYND